MLGLEEEAKELGLIAQHRGVTSIDEGNWKLCYCTYCSRRLKIDT